MTKSFSAERQALAIATAQAIAHQFDIPRGDPIILKDTNHTIVHLRPTPIVAKVSIQKRFRHGSSSLEREVFVAGLLAARGAPVVRPASMLPPGPHCMEGVELTFWDYCPAKGQVLSREAGRSLRIVHEMLIELRTRLPALPPFTLQINEADETLQLSSNLPQLTEDDRLFLRTLYRTIVDDIRDASFEYQPLHGECNLQQTVSTSSGPLWLDFEATCLGPKEWDLATIDEDAVEAYGSLDPSLLWLLRRARILCITTWCWTQPDRAPEIREAAEYHLESLKRSAEIR